MPERELLDLLTGAWKAQAVHVFAELGIADRLATGPEGVADLAVALEVNEDALRRLMSFLVSIEVISVSEGRYSLTSTGALLVTGSRSMRGLAQIYGAEFANAWTGLIDSVRDGHPAFVARNGAALYEYLDSHSERNALFARAMTGSVFFDEFARSGRFAGPEPIVDIGGGAGHLLASILVAEPSVEGVLFERPTMIGFAAEYLKSQGLAGRSALVAGDFFQDRLPDGSVHLLSRVLHDWSDSDCVPILENVRRSMSTDGTLYIVERIVGQNESDSVLARAFDLHMLVVTGGRERSLADYERLCTAAGLVVSNSHPLPVQMSALEVRRA